MQLQMNFIINKLTYFTGLDDLSWAHKLRAERDEQLKKDIRWLSDLIDKYSK